MGDDESETFSNAASALNGVISPRGHTRGTVPLTGEKGGAP